MQAVVRSPKTINATLTPPGDKSISHRAAIFNAIARIAGPGTAAAVVPMTPPRVLAALAHRDM